MTESTFEHFFVRNFPEVLAFFRGSGSRHESEDLAQETFFRLYRVWRRRCDEELLTSEYLFTIAINLRRDQWQATRRGSRIPIDGLESSGLSFDPRGASAKNDDIRIVRSAIDRLDGQKRRCLLLRLQGFSIDEIAEILRIRPGTAGTHLFRARMELKKLLAEDFEELSCLD